MNFRQLRYFVAIVEEGSFSKAARSLHIAQPSLSQHIVNLEDNLGAQLLIRTPKGVTPTAAGDVLYLHAKKIAAQLKQAQDDVRLEADTPKGEVALVLPLMLSQHVPALLMKRIYADYPEIKLRIIEALSLEGYTLIETGRVDIGMLGSDEPLKHINAEALYQEPLYFVEDAASSDGNEEPITFAELTRRPLVVSQKLHAVRYALEKTAAKEKLTLDIKIEASSSRLLYNYLTNGIAAAVLPWPSIHDMHTRGEVKAREIIEPGVSRTVYVGWPKNYPLNAASKVIKDILHELILDLHQKDIVRGKILSH